MTKHVSFISELLTPGGLDEISYVIRLMPFTSLVMRDDIRRRTSGGNTYLKPGQLLRIVTTLRAIPVRSHKVFRGDRTQSNDLYIAMRKYILRMTGLTCS